MTEQSEPVAEQASEASLAARRGSVYEDAISTPALGGAASKEASPMPPQPETIAEEAVERPASPTDNLTLPHDAAPQVNGHVAETPIPRSDANDPNSVLISTLRLQNGDLHSQVSMLNTKLVSSYGRYGDLEEQLEHAKEQLAQLKKQNATLSQERQKWESRLEGGALVEKAHVQAELTQMMDRVLAETEERGKAENAKETIEKELDELSASLFGEANTMVAVEREARARADAKSRSLEDRLKDTEGLISHQADQMRQLGGVIETVERERDEARAKLAGFESDPALIAAGFGAMTPFDESLPSSPRVGSFFAAPRLPELLTDILPHHEFHIFVRHLHRLRVNTLSRPNEPSSTSMGLGLGGNSAPPSPDPQGRLNEILPLSQHLSQPFIKRCQEEDSDPTLRLDLAPGISWLNRRQIGQAIVDGQLIIEPSYTAMPPTEKCAMCGVSLERWLVDPNEKELAPAPVTGGQAAIRKLMGTQTWSSQGWAKWSLKTPAQTAAAAQPAAPASPGQSSPIHVFRTADASSTATRHALCPTYCLPRLRAVCDLWTAIRNIERSLLMGERTPTPGFGGSGLKNETSRKNLGIGSVSNLLRRAGSSEVRGSEATLLPQEDPDEQQQPRAVSAPVLPAPAPEKLQNTAVDKVESVVEGEQSVEAAVNESAAKEADGEAEKAVEEAAAGEAKTDEAKADGEAPKVEDAASVPSTPNLDADEDTPKPDKAPAKLDIPAETPTSPLTDSLSPTSGKPAPPPLPKRSAARPNRTPSPVSAKEPLAPAAAIRPPPVRRVTSNKPVEAPAVASSWEEKAWQDLVKLKEALFWTRIGVVSGERNS